MAREEGWGRSELIRREEICWSERREEKGGRRDGGKEGEGDYDIGRMVKSNLSFYRGPCMINFRNIV